MKPRRPPPNAAGYTLLEVMITVAIVAILASIAMPSYTDYLRRGQLPEGHNLLSEYRVKMEQYFQDFRNYGTAGTCTNDPNAPAWAGFNTHRAKYFTLSCQLLNGGSGYLLTATGSAGRAVGHTYTVDHDNARATPLFKNQANAKACWLIRGDEC